MKAAVIIRGNLNAVNVVFAVPIVKDAKTVRHFAATQFGALF